MKITIKQIFEDNFKEFWEKSATKYPEDMRKDMLDEVLKMLG
jgi:hypothetical protein